MNLIKKGIIKDMDILNISDNLNNKDQVSFSMKRSPYVRTKIRAGYDAYKDKNGITQFGETVFETENMIVLGGSLFTLEKVFGVTSPLTVRDLRDIASLPSNDAPINNNKDTYVCLFGVGTGGAGESMTDVKDVEYYEDTIEDMIPFRQTDSELTSDEALKYWFKKPITVNIDGGQINKTAYYLKRFETTPEIFVLWRDAEGDEDGSEVGGNVHETPSTNTTPIETFIELTLKITKKDVREFFNDNGNIEATRINSIGLFTGVKNDEDDDYQQVKLFSKLNINNEILVLSKDLTISYRIYTS